MLRYYFKSLYQDAMSRAYATAHQKIAASIMPDSLILDCGANNGWTYERLTEKCKLSPKQYHGIEWNEPDVIEAQRKGLNIIQGDLNKGLPFESNIYSCVYATSVLEHLLNPCKFMSDCYRVLRPGGSLVILTPNISTYFTALLILLGRMPSSGPHPDSDHLLKTEEIFKVSSHSQSQDSERETPVHRHIVVFSYLVLLKYLRMIGFSDVTGQGFGLYPFPKQVQPILEKIDPYHCHQMVFVAKK